MASISDRRIAQDELRLALVTVLTEWRTGPSPAEARTLFAKILELDAEMEYLAESLPFGPGR